jgi:hypothetical protein
MEALPTTIIRRGSPRRRLSRTCRLLILRPQIHIGSLRRQASSMPYPMILRQIYRSSGKKQKVFKWYINLQVHALLHEGILLDKTLSRM